MSESVADYLKDHLKVRGILYTMAKDGEIDKVECKTDVCYCPHGADYFDPRPPPAGSWTPTIDHFPKLKSKGGILLPDNVRLAHRLCNNLDFAILNIPEERRFAQMETWRQKFSV